MVGGDGVLESRVGFAWMIGEVEVGYTLVLVVDLEVAVGSFRGNPGRGEGCFSKKMWVLT